MRVILLFKLIFRSYFIFFFVLPDVICIMVMRPALVQETKPFIKALVIRESTGIGFSKSPLSGNGSSIPRLLQHFGNGDIPCIQRDPAFTTP